MITKIREAALREAVGVLLREFQTMSGNGKTRVYRRAMRRCVLMSVNYKDFVVPVALTFFFAVGIVDDFVAGRSHEFTWVVLASVALVVVCLWVFALRGIWWRGRRQFFVQFPEFASHVDNVRAAKQAEKEKRRYKRGEGKVGRDAARTAQLTAREETIDAGVLHGLLVPTPAALGAGEPIESSGVNSGWQPCLMGGRSAWHIYLLQPDRVYSGVCWLDSAESKYLNQVGSYKLAQVVLPTVADAIWYAYAHSSETFQSWD